MKTRIAMMLILCLLIPYVQMPNNEMEKEAVKTVKAEILSKEAEWNIKRLHAETAYEDSINAKRIKVAVLDSGLDYDEDIPFVERKDFLGEEELHYLYQDYTGHGTSVASLICAKKNDDNITGIAANVDLYVARILDKNNQAPVERVIKAIKWAMEKKVNIIHMSFGTKEYSRELEYIIQKAYKQGILIIASAGNDGTAAEDESTIEYPAVFDEVIAVGATNTYNEKTDTSASGEELDIVAPGDQILATSHFSGVAVEAGTSISAAQVTGIAAVLWGKYPDKSNTFIRSLLLENANGEAVGENCGKGMVDYEQSNANYKKMDVAYTLSKKFGLSEEDALENAEESVDANVKKLSKASVNYVTGSWYGNTHAGHVSGIDDKTYLDIVKVGAMEPDKYEPMSRMKYHEVFHGGGNYMANTQYIYTLALKYFSAGDKDVTLPTYQSVFGKNHPYKKIVKMDKDKRAKKDIRYIMMDDGKKTKKCLNGFFASCETNSYNHKTNLGLSAWITKDKEGEISKAEINKRKGYALLGMALHNATDVLAHRGYRKINGTWAEILHNKTKQKGTLSWLWVQMESAYVNHSIKEVQEYYTVLLEDAVIADDADKFSERNARAGELATEIISFFNKDKPKKECYDAFYMIAKTGATDFKVRKYWKYWEEIKGNKKNVNSSGKKIKTRKLKRFGIDVKPFQKVKKKDITVRANKKKTVFVFLNTQKGDYLLMQGKTILGANRGNGKKIKISVPTTNINGNKVTLYLVSGQKSRRQKLNIKCTVKFAVGDEKKVKQKKKLKERTITFNPKKPIPEFNKAKKNFTLENKKKNKVKEVGGWSIKPNGKIITVFSYKLGRTVTLYPQFVKKENKETKNAKKSEKKK